MIKINNRILDTDIYQILEDLQRETDYILSIKKSSNSVMVTCPFHADGHERHPSCGIIADPASDREGVYHCFTCGEKGPIYQLVGYCFGESSDFGKQWLLDKYGNIFSDRVIDLPEITLNRDKQSKYLDESILEKYSYFHPYMFKRGLSEEIIRRFNIGYNHDTNSITFPVRDVVGNLVMITERNVSNKHFYIPEADYKPVYLLDYIVKNNITDVIVCESQINALTCWTWGLPAIALIGTGSEKQYEILRKSGIRSYHLALDGDLAGHHGNLRFINSMPDHVMIDIIQIPAHKDVNDLTKDEFLNLPRIDKNNSEKSLIFTS